MILICAFREALEYNPCQSYTGHLWRRDSLTLLKLSISICYGVAPASHKDRVDIASSINLDLYRLKDWGFQNLVNFNAVKTQCCLISRRVDRNLPDIFDSNSLKFSDKISMLDLTLGSDLSWNDHNYCESCSVQAWSPI